MYEQLSQRDEMLMMISDMHKDAYGYRPTGYRYLNMTDIELSAEIDHLQGAVNRAIQEEEERENVAANRFKARIAEMFDLGAADEATAIRWIMDAEECHDDDELEYRLGLPYGYFKK